MSKHYKKLEGILKEIKKESKIYKKLEKVTKEIKKEETKKGRVVDIVYRIKKEQTVIGEARDRLRIIEGELEEIIGTDVSTLVESAEQSLEDLGYGLQCISDVIGGISEYV